MNNYKDLNNVKEVIENYIKGTYEADISLLKNVFHEKARMSGYLGDKFVLGGPEPFYEDLESHPSMKENKDNFTATITYIDITENIASATLYETGFFGDTCIEDHFHLIKLKNGEWKIISKAFSVIA
ncbi:nuclear transport factor 2 family protein [Tepidanaerobacter syntrophicus]|uniref:nuclear transport factor 2 family protein n=1 Tax=Tepidanaerobacter syntrophicus TaxID=224999 RepID=UPI001BD450F2|nr:nuclear transport factor 2 family protein [Tepidanaerobacter syntrophicus]